MKRVIEGLIGVVIVFTTGRPPTVDVVVVDVDVVVVVIVVDVVSQISTPE